MPQYCLGLSLESVTKANEASFQDTFHNDKCASQHKLDENFYIFQVKEIIYYGCGTFLYIVWFGGAGEKEREREREGSGHTPSPNLFYHSKDKDFCMSSVGGESKHTELSFFSPFLSPQTL